jgi:hypothetical protein
LIIQQARPSWPKVNRLDNAIGRTVDVNEVPNDPMNGRFPGGLLFSCWAERTAIHDRYVTDD